VSEEKAVPTYGGPRVEPDEEEKLDARPTPDRWRRAWVLFVCRDGGLEVFPSGEECGHIKGFKENVLAVFSDEDEAFRVKRRLEMWVGRLLIRGINRAT